MPGDLVFPAVRDGSRIVIGVDFTSAPCRRKPITLAIGSVTDVRGRMRYRLDGVHALESFVAFETFLQDERPWLGGFDLPFGQPRTLIEHEGWPVDWAEFVRFFCAQPKPLLRRVFKRWCDARPVGDKFAWRKADKPAGSSPAMRWTNPPVAWMMHAGIGRMLGAGLSFPAHRHGPRGPAASRRIALEAYPAFTARQACPGSYKSDTPSKQTADRRRTRSLIVAALERGTAGLAPALAITPRWRRRLVADGSGDLLDAVICALQATHAGTLSRYGLPRALDPLEGWIASVPVG